LHLNWKENLFLFVLTSLFAIRQIFRKPAKDQWNSSLIFILIFLLSQFYISNFHPESIKWWFASIPGWLTLFIAFLGSLSLVSYQRIRVDSQPTQASNQTFNDLITKATPGIIVVSLAMFFIFVLNIDEISPQTKLIPDYSIYIIIAFGFALFYSLKFSLNDLSLKKMGKFLQPAVFGVLIFLIGIGALKTYIVYTAYHKALHSRSEEKLWQDLLALNKIPRIKSIDIKAKNELGKISMEKGNFEEAANYYKKILADQAFNFEANLGLAEVAYKQKEWGKAHEAYKRAIYLKPNETTKVIEASEWQGRSGENIYQNGDMYWGGAVSTFVLLKGGNAKFILQARGTPAKGIWPHMVVKLDNEIIGEVDVTTEKLNDYEFKKVVKPGKYNLSISFTNDDVTWDKTGKLIEDRNLFVKRCRIVYEE
jgi:tetratricopeptide (TPR) repeat protein